MPPARRRCPRRPVARGGKAGLQQRVLRREVVQERLLADPHRLRDRVERRARRSPRGRTGGSPLRRSWSCAVLPRSSASRYSQACAGARAAPRAASPPTCGARARRPVPASDGVSPRSARAVASNQVVRSSSNSCADRLLHPPRERLVRLALLGVDRVAVAHRHDGPARSRPPLALRHRLVRADDRDRHQADPELEREARGAVPEPLHVPVRRPRALGEHHDRPALVDQLARLVDRARAAAAAIDRERAEHERGERLAPPHVEEVVARRADRRLALPALGQRRT